MKNKRRLGVALPELYALAHSLAVQLLPHVKRPKDIACPFPRGDPRTNLGELWASLIQLNFEF